MKPWSKTKCIKRVCNKKYTRYWPGYLFLTFFQFSTFVKNLKSTCGRELCWKEIYTKTDKMSSLCLRDARNFWNSMGRCTYLSEHRISDTIQVHRAFICQVVENIQSTDCFWSSLFVAKYEVNPLMELARNKFAFQGLKWFKKTNWRLSKLSKAPYLFSFLLWNTIDKNILYNIFLFDLYILELQFLKMAKYHF